MKTTKIINLLVDIANGKEVPKKIKYNNIEYFWCNQCKIYERLEDDSKDLYNDLDNLNDEVEIIEEDKKIEKLYVMEKANYFLIGENEHIYYRTESNVNNIIADKINEIIDKLNEMSDEE